MMNIQPPSLNVATLYSLGRVMENGQRLRLTNQSTTEEYVTLQDVVAAVYDAISESDIPADERDELATVVVNRILNRREPQ